MNDRTTRTLTVYCRKGLGDRLLVLVSGLALAQAAGRSFTMLWPRTPECAAVFSELFENRWNVREVPAEETEPLPYGWSLANPDPPDLLAMNDDHLVLGAHHILVRPDLYPAHAPLEAVAQLFFRQLTLTPAISAQVDAFRANHFRSPMIGVHLRRGDFVAMFPHLTGNTRPALAALDTALAQLPEAGILLCTDDGAPHPQTGRAPKEGLKVQFARLYGERIVWTEPRSLDRGTVAAVQDAMVDLWLLRQTDYLIGTTGSAFSKLAVYGRDVPHVFCKGITPAYRRALWLYKLSGIYRLVRWLGRREFGRNVAFPSLLRYYRARLWFWRARE
jgi:hypothetical protein